MLQDVQNNSNSNNNMLAKKTGWAAAAANNRTVNSPNVVNSNSSTSTNSSSNNNNNNNTSDNALRDQLHLEIENKSKSCNNPAYHCSIPRVDGFEYCIRHILRDPRGQYRQCTFVYDNGRKCQNAVLKHDNIKDPALTTFCFEHSRQAQLKKTRATVGKFRDSETNEVFLNYLTHHIKIDVPVKELQKSNNDEVIDVVSPQVIPFSTYKNLNTMADVLKEARKKQRVLDFASDTSEEDVTELKKTKLRTDFDESDDESMGSDEDDSLRRANIYTIDESLKLSVDKLKTVKKLYEAQARHLYYLLKERRRNYLIQLRKEREMHCSIYDQAKYSSKELSIYTQLKLLTRYHRRHGNEAVLYRKYKEKRLRSYDVQKTILYPKCVFTEGGVKCGERTIPCSKFCRKHILEDKKQTLFRACHVEKSNVVCHEPTICIGEDSNCLLHLFIPPKQQYTQKKNDSETEDEDMTSCKNTATTTIAYNVRNLSTTTTTTSKQIKSLNDNNNDSVSVIKTKVSNVEVMPIHAKTIITKKPTVATTALEIEKTTNVQQENVDNIEIAQQQHEEEKESTKNVLETTTTKAVVSRTASSRRQQRRSNNRRKQWTNRHKKRQLLPEQQQPKQPVKQQQQNLIQNKQEQARTPTTTTNTTKLPTNKTINTMKIHQTIIRKKPIENQEQQQQQQQQTSTTTPTQSLTLLQQQQQIVKQLQKQQVQQSTPQIFQIQKQQNVTAPAATTSFQYKQQQEQPKTYTLANVKKIINLQQLQQQKLPQQQQQQQQQVLKIPKSTNIKQFVSLSTQQQQKLLHLPKQQNMLYVRLPNSTTAAASTTLTTTTTTTTAVAATTSSAQKTIISKQQQQIIQLPVQRTARYQLQPTAGTSTTITKIGANTISTAGVASGGNVTYHTIPGLPKSTSVIVNKHLMPKTAVTVNQQQQQQQQPKQAASQQYQHTLLDK